MMLFHEKNEDIGVGGYMRFHSKFSYYFIKNSRNDGKNAELCVNSWSKTKKSDMRNGFLRVAAVAPVVKPGDVKFNVEEIKRWVDRLEEEGVEVGVFPEMSITGYTCGDLFHNFTLIDGARQGLENLAEWSTGSGVHFAVGLPVVCGGSVYNCAALIYKGNVNLVAKTYVPNYNEFYERRWWQGAPKDDTIGCVSVNGEVCEISSGCVFECCGTRIGIEICEDLWVAIPPSSRMALEGAKVILNLSASDDLIGKYSYLTNLIKQHSAATLSAYVYAGAGWGESSTDLVFDGKAIIAENGSILAASPRWADVGSFVVADVDILALERDRMHFTTFGDCARNEAPRGLNWDSEMEDGEDIPEGTLRRHIDPHPFVPGNAAVRDERCEEIVNIQAAGLAKRLEAIGCKSLVVGISGGLDSTLALLVAVKSFDRLGLDRKGIVGITMPGFGTTDRTHSNAVELMRAMGVTDREIPIAKAVRQHFEDIGHDETVHDVTYENSQARERTQILMDVANQVGGIVLGTGDLSELALGWATYNGDHMSMYGVNSSVPKTLVKYLVGYFADQYGEGSRVRELLLDIVDTPISPELLPANADGEIEQKTEDLVGPYELHDFFLYYMLRYGFTPQRIFFLACEAFGREKYSREEILKWLKVFTRRFFTQQFKRSCMPDGPKVGSVCLSPRGDWRMPSDASYALWMADIDKIKIS